MKKKPHIINIANYIIKSYNEDAEIPISFHKLDKVCCYASMISLANRKPIAEQIPSFYYYGLTFPDLHYHFMGRGVLRGNRTVKRKAKNGLFLFDKKVPKETREYLDSMCKKTLRDLSGVQITEKIYEMFPSMMHTIESFQHDIDCGMSDIHLHSKCKFYNPEATKMITRDYSMDHFAMICKKDLDFYLSEKEAKVKKLNSNDKVVSLFDRDTP